MIKLSRNLINDLMNFDGMLDNSPYNINNGIERLIHITSNKILSDVAYRLFYIIRENFQTNLNIFSNTIIDYDCFGFATVKRNTRNSIEAYCDLFNLVANNDYIEIMKKSSSLPYDRQKYTIYMNSFPNSYNDLTIQTKRLIAEKNGLKPMFSSQLKNCIKFYNNYVHPNVFIMEFNNNNNNNNSESDIKELLCINIALEFNALCELTKYVENNYTNISPNDLNTHRSSLSCMSKIVNDFMNLIDIRNINEEF